MADNRDTFVSEIYVNNEQANDAIAEMTKQLTKLTDKYDDLAAKNEKLAEKTAKAKAAMDETRKSLEGMAKDTEEYAKTSKKLKEQEKAYNDLAKKLEISKHKTDEAKREMDSMQESIKRANDGVKKFGKAMENLAGKSMENLVRMQRQLRSELDRTKPNTKEWDELSKKYQRVTAEIKRLESAQSGVVIKQKGWLRQLNDVAGAFLLIGKGIRTAIALARRFAEAYKTISNFEQANANLASILGATSEQMEKLEKSAIQLGSSTRYSASQVTGLQTELAKLGFTVKEITDMSPAVLNFAGSVGTDLASAASLAGVALRSFNLQSDQTEDALGTMAVACNKSALSFEYLQNSFSTIAPVAKTYGLSLKDTIALLGTLANAGFDASSAATATRNILLNLSDTNGKLAKALGGSVHSFEDIMGAMKKLRDQGVDLNKTLELTDKRSVAAFNTFLDGAESAMELRGELEDVNGELQRMAEQRANTVEGAIDGMKSAWEGLVLSFRNSTGKFAKVFKFITQGINGIRDLIDPEGSIVERTAKNYAEVFRGMGNEFISLYETQERIQKRFEEMNKAIDAGGGTARYKRYAKEGLQKAYDEVMSELESQAETANAKVLELNTKFMNEEQKILKQQAELTKNGLNESNMAAYNKLQEQLEANRKAWNQAVADATRFKEKMEDVVSGDTTTTTNGGGGGGGSSTSKESPYKQALKDLQDAQREEENDLKEHYLNNKLTTEEYQKQMREINIKYLVQKVELAKEYGEDETAALSAYLDAEIAAADAAQKELDALYKERDNWQKEVDDEFKVQQERLEWLKQEAEKIKESLLSQAQIRELDKQSELALLEELHTAKLLSEEEFQAKKQEIIKRYNQENLADDLDKLNNYFEAANKIASGASDFITALREAETASLEAEYQKQLTAAGSNTEKREAIEADYEQKKLDMQKKYADVDMVINIAKAVASGALAAVEAFAAAGGNPILGAVYAAIIAATTAAEVASIVAQRNAIKNASVGSSGSTVSTGQRVMTGYAGGGFTENQTTVTTVGEEGTEWIAPHWLVRKEPVMFRNLEQYRRAGSHGRSGSVKRGFADGGYTSSPSAVAGQMASANDEIDWQAMREFNAILRYCAENGLFVKYGDIMVAKEKYNSFKKQTSRT